MAVNLKELSDMLGLSQTTVSRAINGYPEVAEKTRARILQAAKATGYRASQAARNLARGAPRLIGVTLPNSDLEYQAFTTLLPILVERAVWEGFRIVLIPAVREDDGQNFVPHVLGFDIEGLIWVGPNQETQKILCEQHPQIPVVFLRLEGVTDDKSNWVAIDYAAGARSAATLLYHLGHRGLHLLLDRSAGARNELLIAGARLAAATCFAPGQEDISFNLVPPAHACNQFFFDFIQDGWPTAIITSDMTMFRLLRKAALEKGLVVGRDVSIIGQDVLNTVHHRSDLVDTTLLHLTGKQIAATLIEAITARIREPKADFVQVSVKPDLVIGQSTGPAPMDSVKY